MATYNRVTLMGHLARDPELRHTQNGTTVASLGLGLNRKWRDESGEAREEISFVDCTAFGRTAEVAAEYLRKGNPVLIEGRLKQETWTSKENEKKSRLVVVVENLVLLGTGTGAVANEKCPEKEAAPAKPATRKPAQRPARENPPEDDVPF